MMPKKIMGIDQDKFIRLIKKRSGKDPLHVMSDETVARLAFANLSIIAEIEKSLQSTDEALKMEDKIKAINAVKGSTAAVNDVFKNLGLTISTRETADEEESALHQLMAEDISSNVPPALQEEYLHAQKDRDKLNQVDSEEDKEIVNQISTPLSSFDKPKEKKEEVDAIDVEEVGIRKIG
jgi:hypothetical protein